jgi:O-acetyl-ADP-ribose deacetylase (regulator of RNase III)
MSLDKKIKLVIEDISKMELDAIVNAANEKLMFGSGVCGAVFNGAGPEMTNACQKIGFCKTGDAVLTPGFNLKAKYVIHAVGPIYSDYEHNKSVELLTSCYEQSMKIALKNDIKSIAFPCISTGVFHFPKTEAAQIALSAIHSFLSKESLFNEIIICCYDLENFEIYKRHFEVD